LLIKKDIKKIFLRFLPFRSQSKLTLCSFFLCSVFVFDISKAENNNFTNSNKNKNQIEIEYLESRGELEDYIFDTGDAISLEFFSAKELNGVFSVNEEGEVFLPMLDQTFVRGLTKSELKTLLEKRYAELLINPEIKIKIARFKSIRVLATGELRTPGFIQFPAYSSRSNLSLMSGDIGEKIFEQDLLIRNNDEQSEISQNFQPKNQSSNNLIVKRLNENQITISDVIRKAGGITSYTDLSRIEIIRDVPLGKGGGKKKAIINFNGYLNSLDSANDIRIFDGDKLFFPKLSKRDQTQISKSILAGVSPMFISVNIFGRVETPGIIKVPLEATLSDAIDLTGPIKPLSGKIILIRYENDGTVIKKNISYSASAKRGSKRNPFLKKDDLISVKTSFFGKTTDVLKEFTAPFAGIYSTKKLYEDLTK